VPLPQEEIKYLGFIVGTKGVRMGPEKVSWIMDWQILGNVMDVQCFQGFANFYRRFIRDYCKVVSLLTCLIKKEAGKYVPFMWGLTQRKAFEDLKKVFTTVPILHHFDYNREIVVKTNASD
jgi:hypothetical protein